MKCVYWSRDIKVGIPQIENTKSSSCLATIMGVPFQQGNDSTYPENRHIKTVTHSNPKENGT